MRDIRLLAEWYSQWNQYFIFIITVRLMSDITLINLLFLFFKILIFDIHWF